MAIPNFPGVYPNEVDLSQYISATVQSRLTLIAGFRKGPVNTPFVTVDDPDFTSFFGVSDSGWALPVLAGLQYLRYGRSLQVIRVTDGAEAKATVTIPGDAAPAIYRSPVDISGQINMTTRKRIKIAITESVDLVAAFQSKVDISSGVDMTTNKNVKITKTEAGVPVQLTVDLSAGAAILTAVTPDEIALNLNTAFVPGFAEVYQNRFVVLHTNAPGGATDSISFAAPATIDVTQAVFGIAPGSYPYTTAGVAAGAAVTKEIDLSLNAPDVVHVSIDYIVSRINDPIDGFNRFQHGAFIADRTNSGKYIVLRTASDGAAAEIDFLQPATPSEDVSVQVFGISNFPATYNGSDLTADALVVRGVYPGTYCENWQVQVSQGAEVATFKLAFYDYQGNLVVAYDNLTKENIEPTISGTDSNIEVIAGTSACFPHGSSLHSGAVTARSYFLVGGNDGIAGLNDSDYIGTVNGAVSTGMQLLMNTTLYETDMLAVPGISSGAVIQEGILMAKIVNCFFLADPPIGLDYRKVADFHNGLGSWAGLHSAFNSSFGAIYWPWVLMRDPQTNQNIWTPPSGWVAGQYAYNDTVADPWFAPAGLTRGRLLNALDTESVPDLGAGEYLYSNGNAVNPIINFPREGVTIWGQRTLQRNPTALDRVNVRRMLSMAERTIAKAARIIVFEPNDPITWRRLEDLINPYLRNIAAKRGIDYFEVKIDSSTNTDFYVNQNILYGKIYIVPTKAAERIALDFVLLPSGGVFAESIA